MKSLILSHFSLNMVSHVLIVGSIANFMEFFSGSLPILLADNIDEHFLEFILLHFCFSILV